ncbi:MAG: hypothetical protein ACFE8L_10075 [Candidatus Hodarchaeota archaeon]
MNVMAFNSLIILTIIRIIAVIVSVDFFYDNKKKEFIFLIIGWSSWAFAGLLTIVGAVLDEGSFLEFYIFLNSIFAALAGLYILVGVFSYFIEIQNKFIIILTILVFIIPILLLMLVGANIGSLFSSLVLILSIISIYVVLILRFKPLKDKLGKSIRWYYITGFFLSMYIPLTIFISLQGESIEIYTSQNMHLIMWYWLPGIITSVLIIIFLIHLEYNISYEQKKDLKDKYSHNLGNVLQAIETAHQLILSSKNITKDGELLEVINILESKMKEGSDIINEIRKL